MTEELRLYTFTNFMLSPIQQGIQAGHAAVELGVQAYKKQMQMRSGTEFSIYWNWATNWKTMICLNGGNAQELKELVFFFSNHFNGNPWCGFYESPEALDSALTSVAIILPARIFETASALRNGEPGLPEYPYPESFNEWELELIDLLSKTGMAR